ncbi:MAG: hypothetical protein ABR606_03855 [Vicinamibacterales bacterium]
MTLTPSTPDEKQQCGDDVQDGERRECAGPEHRPELTANDPAEREAASKESSK